MTVQVSPLTQLATTKSKLIWIKSHKNEPNYINQIVMVS